MKIFLSAIVCLIVFFSLPLSAQLDPNQKITYTIAVKAQKKAVKLQVGLAFKANTDTLFDLSLPHNWYDTNRETPLAKVNYLTKIEGKGETKVSNVKTSSCQVMPGPNSEVELSYELNFNASSLHANINQPHVGTGYLHLQGCHFLLPLGSEKDSFKFEIDVIDFSEDWSFYSAIGEDPMNLKGKASYGSLATKAWGGGTYDVHDFSVNNNSLRFFSGNAFSLSKAEQKKDVEASVRGHRNWWQDDNFRDYQIVILPGMIKGHESVYYENLMVTFMDPGISSMDFRLQFAKEHFRLWMPGRLRVDSREVSKELKWEWFFDGFPTYFSRQLLLKEGRLSEDEYVSLINKNIVSFITNPNNEVSYDQLLEEIKKSGDPDMHHQLSIDRGVLMAMYWETLISPDNGLKVINDPMILQDLMVFMYRFGMDTEGRIDGGDFRRLLDPFGIDTGDHLDEFLYEGHAIPAQSEILDGKYVLERRPIESQGGEELPQYVKK